MAKYQCTVCGYIFDEAKEGKAFAELDACPVCGMPPEKFVKLEDEAPQAEAPEEKAEAQADIAYDSAYYRVDANCRYMEEIHQMAVTGKSIIGAMGTQMKMPNWDDVLILGNQLNPPPLNDDEPVTTMTVIGKNAKRPMIIDSPVFISHMSFGALSKETKIALARGSAMAKTAMCSGEGGILPEERTEAYKYIFEYIPNLYSVTAENLKNADAIEIKIGQGTKPGMGGHLPGEKVTPEIAAIRNKPLGQDIISPSKFPDVNTKEDLKALVDKLREESDGRPVGIKIAAGKIEKDLEFCVFAEPDFITIDGRGGATGASPQLVRDSTSVPTLYALYRARKYLDSVKSDIALVITGGLRVSSGICGTGKCPVGIATQDEELRKRLKIDAAAQRVANFLICSNNELKTYARITGHKNVHDLNTGDLCTINKEISDYTNIPHA